MTSDADPLGAFVPGPRAELDGAEDGPLASLAFAAKDNFDVAGHVTGAGNPDWRRTHGEAGRHARAVERLLQAGARLAGKTVMDELAFGALGENAHYGTPLNPAAPDRVPGGSSSGSASAVAGGAVDFALGTDSACSVRLPASLCGLYGMRPTHARIPVEGTVALSPSLDTVGWLARSSEVMERVGAVLLDPGPQSPVPEHLLVARDAFALARAPVALALEPVVERLAEQIGSSDSMDIGEPGTPRALGLFLMRSGAVQISEVWQCHGEWIEGTRPDSHVLTRENMRAGAESTPAQLAEARREWSEMRGWIRERIPPGSLLCMPTAIDVAPMKGLGDEERRSFTVPTLAMLAVAVLAGLPQISLPVARVGGLPVGLSLVGPAGSDERLLEVARGFPL